MLKRYLQVFVVLVIVGAILWLVLIGTGKGGPADSQAARANLADPRQIGPKADSSQQIPPSRFLPADTSQQISGLDERVVEEMNNRKSPRHTSGELEKRRRVMLADLEKAIRDEEDKVEQQKKNLATTIRTKGIINKGEDSPPDPSYRSPNEDSITRSVPESKEQLEQRKMRLESQINSLLTYKSEQLRAYAAGVDLPDNAVKGLYPKYLEAQREIERLKSEGFVGNDPAFQARINQMESIRRLIDASIVILGKKLHAELELNENRMKVATLRNASARDATIKTRSE